MAGPEHAQIDPPPGPLAGYRALPGAADELLDASGAVRPAWHSFVDHLAGLAPEEMTRRFARGDQYLRDAGVFYRQYEPTGSTQRDWPLSHLPVLISEGDWRQIAEGLVQRADLLEAVVADLYGPGRLVADGHLPASLIAASREWLRPLVGVRPRSGRFLHFLAFEIGRGPDGTWWVLGDRTQAPSGAGFAIENRIATSRVFPEAFADANVYRLAKFFRNFRDALHGLRNDSDSRVAILTPGLLNDAYFEHAYIARYLGCMLLEGEDLTVVRGQVMVRTVAGLRPVSVLWRRLDASYADPLELDERSRLGTPGLVGAVRKGSLAMVNALGAGLLETRALLAFLPRICQALRGEPLKLPNIATWWCGQPSERAHVRDNIDGMMVVPALSTRPPFESDDATVLGRAFRPSARQSVGDWLEAEGPLLVGQEAVKLSTTPAWVDGRLTPRPMSLRVFLARTHEGWQVMPGGFARIGGSEDPTAIALQRGGSVADVWVIADAPVDAETMLPQPAAPFLRVQPGVLPSRAADNLYWLGRYVERAEGIMRLLRAYQIRLAETAHPDAPLLTAVAKHLNGLEVDPAEGMPRGLRNTIAAAIGSANKVRDRFSVDGWMALSDLDETAQGLAATVLPDDDAGRAMSVLLRKITGFSGLVHENMYRFTGWRFLSIGRALERALAMAIALERFADPGAPEGALELAIEIGDSVMTHRRRYAVATNRETVIDLLALDEMNPRSVQCQLGVIRELVDDLPGAIVNGQMSALSRAALKTHTALAVLTPETLNSAALARTCEEIAGLSDLLTAAYLK